MTAPFDLNLRHLRALVAIVSEGGMSRAARAEGLSQPALTQGIGKLERQLGVTLFDRLADGVRPTAAGTAMASRVAAAFAHLAEAARAIGRGGARGFSRPEQLMTATQLRAYLALADGGSFVGAATLVGQSQPAIHRAVRDLERICGVVLVERRGRGVVLTEAGRRLARGGRLAVREIEGGLAEALPPAPGIDRLVIGAMPLCRAVMLPHAVAAEMRAPAPLALDIREGSWRELVEPLRDGVIDIMIGALRPDAPSGLVQRPLMRDQIAVIGRAGHPLAKEPDPASELLAASGWIVAPPGSPLRVRWDEMFAGGPVPPTPIECGSVMVIRGVLSDSDLLTLLSPEQVALEIRSGMLTTIGPPLPHGVRTIGVTTRADWRPTTAQARFLARLDHAAGCAKVQESG